MAPGPCVQHLNSYGILRFCLILGLLFLPNYGLAVEGFCGDNGRQQEAFTVATWQLIGTIRCAAFDGLLLLWAFCLGLIIPGPSRVAKSTLPVDNRCHVYSAQHLVRPPRDYPYWLCMKRA
jgi:hypothetical protein